MNIVLASFVLLFALTGNAYFWTVVSPNETLDLGRFFIQPLRISRGTWSISLSHTWEMDGKHRFSPRTVVWRLWPFTVGYAFGWWKDTPEDARVLHQEIPGDDDLVYNTYCAINGPVDREKWDKAYEMTQAWAWSNFLDDEEAEMEYMQHLLEESE